MKITVIMTNGRLVTVCAVCIRRLPIYNKGIFFYFHFYLLYSSRNNNITYIYARTHDAVQQQILKDGQKIHYCILPPTTMATTII